MGYSDQKYYDRNFTMIADSKAASGTFTANSTANSLTSAYPLPKFQRNVRIDKLRYVVVAASKTGQAIHSLLNGTNTFATATISSTTTAGSIVDWTLTNTASLATNTFTNTLPNFSTIVLTNTTTTNWAAIGSSTTITVTIAGTATASADSFGAFELFAEVPEVNV